MRKVIEKPKFIEEGKSTTMRFSHVGYFDWNVGITILFGGRQPDYTKNVIFHYNLKCVNGTMKVIKDWTNTFFSGKYTVVYDDLIDMIHSDVAELYMPLFLKILHNVNYTRSHNLSKVLDIWDNPKLLEATKIKRLSETNWRFNAGTAKKIISQHRKSYKLNKRIMVECEQLLRAIES